MKNKNLNLFAGRISKLQLLDQKAQLKVKGGHADPPPIEGVTQCDPPPLDEVTY